MSLSNKPFGYKACVSPLKLLHLTMGKIASIKLGFKKEVKLDTCSLNSPPYLSKGQIPTPRNR